MNLRRTLFIAGGLGLVAAAVALRPSPAPPPARPVAPPTGSSAAEIGQIPPSAPPALALADAARAGARGTVVARLGWGKSRGQIGLPEEDEAEGETPLRLAIDGQGGTALLDPENGRVVRLGADGRVASEVRLPIAHPRDVAVAKDGSLLLLDPKKEGGGVMFVGPDGKTRSTLPLPPALAEKARSVVVSGDDVYVESSRGELTRIGDVHGVVDPEPALAPGRPTRDGRGFLTALISDPTTGAIHVFVVDRTPRRQRWSRLLHLEIPVEGIFLVDTNAAGRIYLGVTAGPRAQLVCLDPEHGETAGVVDLPVNVGPEAILDAKALDEGGVAYSVFTKQEMRIERHDCE